jgi:hypothetical protein
MLSAVLRAGHAPTAGLSHLSTPDSILMSYRNKAFLTQTSLELLRGLRRRFAQYLKVMYIGEEHW